jgi:hypothetical protein
MTRKSSTETLIVAMRILARDIQSGDGVANAAIAEAADRLEELHADHVPGVGKMIDATPFAWATFDGEGSYDLRLYECNESYRDEWLAANGPRYADWVIPLYEAPDELQARIAELEQAAPEPDTVAVDDSQLLDDLELVAREYMTGFSVVYRHACEGEPGGFVAMRRRHRTEPAPTLREAVGRLLAGGE